MSSPVCRVLLAAHELSNPGKCGGLSWSLFNVARQRSLSYTPVHVSFQKQLTRLRKGNWKSAVILTPLCAQTHLRRHTHTLTMVTNQYTHLSNTQLRAGLYEGLILPKCPPCCHLWSPKFEIVRRSLAGLKEGALPVYHFLCFLCLSPSLVISRLYSRQPVVGWCQFTTPGPGYRLKR